MAESNPFMALLAQKMGGPGTTQRESNVKRMNSRDKVRGMRNYTAGRSVSDFIAAQSESPFLRSAYAYAKTIRQRREMDATKKTKQPGEAPETQDGQEEGTDKRTGIKTIASLKRQLKTVEKVTIETQKDTKLVIKAIAEIKKGILGIKNAIQKLKGSFSNITSSITPSPDKSLAASAARMYSTAGADTKELLKPIDVQSEGQDYLYYRGAPEGRQFYKKGKSGAAGAIASRETSEKLFMALDRKLSAISAKMTGGDGDNPMAPKDYGQLKEVDNREETEKLEKALEGALRKVLPSALAEAGVGDQMPMIGGGGGGGFLGGIGALASRAAGSLARGAAALGRSAWKGAKNIGTKVGDMFKRTPSASTVPTATPTMPTGGATTSPTVPTTEAAKKAAEQTAGATAQKAAEKGGTAAAETVAKTGTKTAAKTAGKTVLKSALKKIPIIGALAGLGFGAQRALSGDLTGAGLEVASGLAGTLPGLGTAASVGIDAGLAARDMGLLGKSAMPNPVKTDIPGTIMERSSANMQAARQTAAPIIVNAPSTPPAVPPPPQPKPISATPTVRNPDDAYMRATYKDFYHPSSLYK